MASEGGFPIGRVIAGCLALVALAVGGLIVLFFVAVVGQNVVIGDAPDDVDTTFEATIRHDRRSGRLDGEGAVIVQEWVAGRTSASLNPVRIMAYNFDYHVVGTSGYELSIRMNPKGGYSPSYGLTQSGTGFVWREDGAAFAQIRSADFEPDTLVKALEPHITWDP